MDPVSFLLWRFYYFFRDPRRHPPSGRVILAPADGRILYVTPVRDGVAPCPVKDGAPVPLTEWVGAVPCDGNGTLVGIYMTPLSVHYNRAPIEGRVTHVVPRPAQGEDLSMARALMRLAWGLRPYEEGSRHITQNARNTVVIDGELRVAVVQIADRFVRCVDCFVAEGQGVAAGEKIGMIRMGSQCDLFIPSRPGVEVQCRPGQSVAAGETVLGVY